MTDGYDPHPLPHSVEPEQGSVAPEPEEARAWSDPDAWSRPDLAMRERIPHFGHLMIALTLAAMGWLCGLFTANVALHFHLFGLTSFAQAATDVHYTLGMMAVSYSVSLLLSVLIFPLVWEKSFFGGLQWNLSAALENITGLLAAAGFCFALAIANGLLFPVSPTDAPIDRIFRAPGAAWMLVIFGVTMAPFFEEIFFRGLLLPTLCTASDWSAERLLGKLARRPDRDGHPRWSTTAMICGSLLTSIPFALMHAEQTAWSMGPLLLLLAVSLVLCWVRLRLRTLAASVLVHAAYNLLLFVLMYLGTNGFKHLDKL